MTTPTAGLSVRITHHARLRYEEAYPQHDPREAIPYELDRSTPVEEEIAARITGRSRVHSDASSTYRLHAERTGLFVLSLAQDVLITFLRFYGRSQHDLAVELFGPGRSPTAALSWVAGAATPTLPAGDTPLERLFAEMAVCPTTRSGQLTQTVRKAAAAAGCPVASVPYGLPWVVVPAERADLHTAAAKLAPQAAHNTDVRARALAQLGGRHFILYQYLPPAGPSRFYITAVSDDRLWKKLHEEAPPLPTVLPRTTIDTSKKGPLHGGRSIEDPETGRYWIVVRFRKRSRPRGIDVVDADTFEPRRWTCTAEGVIEAWTNPPTWDRRVEAPVPPRVSDFFGQDPPD